MALVSSSMNSVLSYASLLEEIFSHLDLKSIKNVCLVSKFWRTSGERSKFWSRAMIKIKENNVHEVLRSTRIKIVPEIQIHDYRNQIKSDEISALFEILVGDNPGLKVLECDVDVSTIPTEVLCSVSSRLQSLTLSSCSLNTEQLTAVWRTVAEGRASGLTDLSVSFMDHSGVPSDVLATACSKVEKLELVGDEFTTEQLTAVYCRVSFSDSRLRELRVRRNDHSAVPFVDLVFALSKLEHVELYATYLSTEQLTAIYQMVDRKFTGKLKKLDVLDNDHSFVSKSLKRKVKLDERRWVK